MLLYYLEGTQFTHNTDHDSFQWLFGPTSNYGKVVCWRPASTSSPSISGTFPVLGSRAYALSRLDITVGESPNSTIDLEVPAVVGEDEINHPTSMTSTSHYQTISTLPSTTSFQQNQSRSTRCVNPSVPTWNAKNKPLPSDCRLLLSTSTKMLPSYTTTYSMEQPKSPSPFRSKKAPPTSPTSPSPKVTLAMKTYQTLRRRYYCISRPSKYRNISMPAVLAPCLMIAATTRTTRRNSSNQSVGSTMSPSPCSVPCPRRATETISSWSLQNATKKSPVQS